MRNNFFVLLYCLLALISAWNPFSHAVETIFGNKYVTLGTTIASPNGTFELGFFKPGKSTKYYVGIWYKNILPQTVVWVANRVTPVPSHAINSTRLKIQDGNLVLVDGGGKLVWSTNITASVKFSSVIATLHDDGNLVLSDAGINPAAPLWQSFDHPTDTCLPGCKLGYNKRTKAKWDLTSWKNPDDPAPGVYTHDNDRNMGFLLWNGTEEYWNTGPHYGNGTLPIVRLNPLSKLIIVENENESYFSYVIQVPHLLTRGKLELNGQQRQYTWSESAKKWMGTVVIPDQQCDVYAYCGPFGICNQNSVPVCDCLQGFRHQSKKEWASDEFSNGCVRNANLKCGSGVVNYQEEDMDRFIMYTNMRLPRHPQNITTGSQAECESICLKNCSCTAYSYSNSSGYCWLWVGQLLNLKQLGEDDGYGNTVYIRLAASEFSNVNGVNSKHLLRQLKAIIPSVTVVAMALLACSIWYFCYKRKTTLKITEHAMDEEHDDADDKKGIDVQFFTFRSILEATDNFSDANELGKGGFGSVYKGMLPGGQNVAVKRLSSESRQGTNEFKNEVVLIAKLQHRNLVKLVGYCTQAEEKILLYEYMPNKSLNSFIFDQTQRFLLDWNERFDIILGIVRGLLYLHHDSRLRIIHRDLKTNNILLDEEMTPKISDFGLARIVAGNTLEENTIKVVGTYGYMSPEYALNGLFSIKSDVFSFGVIILEIISGKKNTAFYPQYEEVSNLLGYAWKLWNEGNAMDFVDDSLLECCNEYEVLKCINVGLLCVEEDPNCRPNMSNVLLMLADESMILPKPNHPAFVIRTGTFNDFVTTQTSKSCSNHLSVSVQEGR